MFACSPNNYITIGGSRKITDFIKNGRVTISDGPNYKHIVSIRNSNVADRKVIRDGKVVYHLVYGEYEKRGDNILRFRKGTGRSKQGKARRFEKLFGHDGVCHSWYNRGRLVRQKFIYDNRRVAYDYNALTNRCTVRNYDGESWMEIKGHLKNRVDSIINDSLSVLSGAMHTWFSDKEPFEVKINGKIWYKGAYEHRQQVGEWIVDGKPEYYIHGVKVSKKLYSTPPEKLDPKDILKVPNAQLRMAMMEKIGQDRIAQCGRVVHKDKAMRLYDIKNYDVRTLKVQCPTTKSFYYLRVPKDATKCEEARQWTFGVGDYLEAPIQFEAET